MSEELVTCPAEDCGKSVKWKDAQNLKKHLDSVHGWSKEEVKAWNEKRLKEKKPKEGKGGFPCDLCPIKCSSQKSLDAHKKNIHTVSSVSRSLDLSLSPHSGSCPRRERT